MSLYNAALLRIDTPLPPTTGGGVRYAQGDQFAIPIDCIVDSPTFLLQREIEQMQLKSTAVLFVMVEDMPTAAAVLLRSCKVLVQQDDQAAVLMMIDHAAPRSFGGISHVMCFLRGTP